MNSDFGMQSSPMVRTTLRSSLTSDRSNEVMMPSRRRPILDRRPLPLPGTISGLDHDRALGPLAIRSTVRATSR